MPLVTSSPCRPPWNQPGGYLQTLIPALFRKVETITLERERIETPDDDFLDLDWCRGQKGADRDQPRRLAIISHGLEGHSKRPYIQGMARALHAGPERWDILAWNCRGCGGDINRRRYFYHSGSSEDLKAVVDHALAIASPTYQEIALIGFSLGGNLTLKYLGECADNADPRIRAAVTFSVSNLASVSIKLARWQNRIYMRDFIRSLEDKMRRKSSFFSDLPDPDEIHRMHTFREYDNYVTAPLHGFESAEDYWEKASCEPFVTKIRIPTLLVNAWNDPFLDNTRFPVKEAEESAFFYLETQKRGGHIGFASNGSTYWSEARALSFLADQIQKTPKPQTT